MKHSFHAVSARRDELLEATVRYLLENGVAELSLRPLAAAIGFEGAPAVYHFGSKEQLLVEAMGLVDSRPGQGCAGSDDDGAGRPLGPWHARTRRCEMVDITRNRRICASSSKCTDGASVPEAVCVRTCKIDRCWIDLLTSTLARALGRRGLDHGTLIVGVIDGLLLDPWPRAIGNVQAEAVNESPHNCRGKGDRYHETFVHCRSGDLVGRKPWLFVLRSVGAPSDRPLSIIALFVISGIACFGFPVC